MYGTDGTGVVSEKIGLIISNFIKNNPKLINCQIGHQTSETYLGCLMGKKELGK